ACVARGSRAMFGLNGRTRIGVVRLRETAFGRDGTAPKLDEGRLEIRKSTSEALQALRLVVARPRRSFALSCGRRRREDQGPARTEARSHSRADGERTGAVR